MTTEAPTVPTVEAHGGDTPRVILRRPHLGDSRAVISPLTSEPRTRDLAEWLRGALADAYQAGRHDAASDLAAHLRTGHDCAVGNAENWRQSDRPNIDAARNMLAEMHRAEAWREAVELAEAVADGTARN